MTRTTLTNGISQRPSRLAHLTRLDPDQLLTGQQRVLEMIAQSEPLRATLTEIAQFSELAIPSMMASLLIYESETDSLRRGGYGQLPSSFADAIDGMKPGPVTGSCGMAAYRSERVISFDVRTDPLWVRLREFAAGCNIVSAWSSPLKDSKNKLLGVFGMYYGECREPSEEDLELVDHFVHLASIAIERHRHDQDCEFRATLDTLTGLGNRGKLLQIAAQIVADPALNNLSHSVALMDFDHFKLHNDTLGQIAADRLLAQAAHRLQASLGEVPLLARFGGDQFVAIFREGTESAQQRVEALLRAFDTPIELHDARIVLSISAGMVEWHPQTTPIDDAFSQAIEAMEVAKRLGRDRCVVFGETERAKNNNTRHVTKLLTEALAQNRVEPHLQPIVHLQSGATIGFELLARFKGAPASGISPAVFVPIAEESSLIDALGISVLRFAFRTLAENSAAMRGITLHVNVSIRQLMRDGLARKATELSKEFCVGTDRIAFEVPESHWLDVASCARASLYALKDVGFRLALDAFGTGYASLSHLHTIPFDQVKIDRAFTAQLIQDDRGRALCDAAFTMATACGMKVTAAGVETVQQLTTLTDMGYEFGQGYFWSKPMPLANTLMWLKSNHLTTMV